MIKSVDILIKMDIQDIIGSEYSLLLCKVYSELYLNGGRPKACERSLRKYYLQIQKDGKMKANLKEEIKNRVLVPKFKGRKHIPGKFDPKGKFVGGHIYIDSANLTDKKALELLKGGWLKESDFKVLPKTEAEKKEIAEKKEPTKEVIKKK